VVLSAEKKAEYLQAPYHCPYCGSSQIGADHFDGECASQRCDCDQCGKSWWDMYKLVDIEEGKDATDTVLQR